MLFLYKHKNKVSLLGTKQSHICKAIMQSSRLLRSSYDMKIELNGMLLQWI